MSHRIIASLIIALVMSSCDSGKHDERLDMIASIAGSQPREALDSLSVIDYDNLNESDRHYYDLLSIKATDKAYIEHSSDSLILDVIDYYEKLETEHYPEALYYGGRVYCDLGDFPTTLRYFQASLELLPPDAENQELRSCVLSQTAWVLNSLRLYKEAIPYIEETIEICREANDSTNEVYDLELLGSIYLRSHDYESAERNLKEAIAKSQYMAPHFKAKAQMLLAATKRKIGQTDSALMLIRGIPDLVKPISRNSALSYSAKIYLDAGILDSAYIFAKELIESKDFINKKSGYLTLLSPTLSEFVTVDSVRSYAFGYSQSFENYQNENETQLSINQQSLYNYQLHERAKDKAERHNRELLGLINGTVIIILIMGIIILLLKNKNKNSIIELHMALENIDRLERSLSQANQTENSKVENTDTMMKMWSVDELRERLRNKLYKLYQENIDKPNKVDSRIIQSSAYQRLQEMIKHEVELKKDDPLWRDLEDVVLSCSPNFIDNLSLLVNGKMTSYDLRTSLLVKCGVTPTQMTILLNRTKGTIVSRRESLCHRIFDQKLGTKVIDGIIHLL